MLDHLQHKRILLASKSPRRHELLKGLDLRFEVKLKDVPEDYPLDMDPADIPAFLAEKKARAFTDELDENSLLITADTIVIQGQNVLEKPANAAEAKNMIRQLAGKVHTVVTGVTVCDIWQKTTFSDHTRVHFMSLTDAEIDYYVERYKPYDKAGAYGVQEWIGYVGIEKLEGSYYNVMGLPVHKLYQVLKNF